MKKRTAADKKRDEKGFTLVEIMVVTALSAVIFYGIFSMMRMGAIQANVAGVKMTIGTSAREGMTRMLQELREANPDSVTVEDSTIRFQNPDSVTDSGTIVWGEIIEYTLGGLDGTQLIREQNGQTTVVANDVQEINFASDDEDEPSLITVEMNIQRQTVQGRTYSENLAGQAQVRNG